MIVLILYILNTRFSHIYNRFLYRFLCLSNVQYTTEAQDVTSFADAPRVPMKLEATVRRCRLHTQTMCTSSSTSVKQIDDYPVVMTARNVTCAKQLQQHFLQGLNMQAIR